MANKLTSSKFQIFYHSLGGKFIIASVLVGFVLIMSSATTQFYINASSHQATTSLETRLYKLNQARIVMDNVWETSFFLEENSIAPSEENKKFIFQKIKTSIDTLALLMNSESENKKITQLLKTISADLSELNTQVIHLLELRSEPAKLYPAIQISRSSMLDNQGLFADLIGIAIDEAVNSPDETSRDTLILLMGMRYQWSQMTSLYRMYLVNRLALLDEKTLTSQVQNIEIFHSGLINMFKVFDKLNAGGDLDFQASDAIPKLKVATEVWINDFRKIASTNTPEKWRTDYPIIKTKIAPLMGRIWQGVREYDRHMEHNIKESLLRLSMAGNNISFILIAFTAAGLVLLIALYYFIGRTLIKPIESISAAMRQEAKDGRYLKPLFIKGKSKETEDLIDAFSMMQLQVHNRKSDLEYQTLHDSLTNLPNRLLLFDRIHQTISQAKRNDANFSLIMIDLDRFKEINDTLGHYAGDMLLQDISNRLVDCLRQVDTVARLGGDEFAVLIPDCDEEQSKKIALKIRECMQSAVQVNGQSLYVSGSLGIAVYPSHGVDSETLLRRADISMYVAKRKGSAFEVYSQEQDDHSINRLELKYKLQKAIDENELELYFQPQIKCQQREVVSAEALVRWIGHKGTIVMPDVFIPMAEECGLIKSLTEWVIVAAIKQQCYWRDNGLNIHISVNLSAKNLLDPDFDGFVFEQYKKYGLPSGAISFEITESAMMEDTDRALVMMKRLKANDFNLIIDDYGTGFSSLAYLKKFPISDLKIDKSFVMNMMENDEDAMIVKSTIDLAHNLGLKVTAEGVESEDVLDMLCELHCDMAQGHFIEKPIAAADFLAWYQLNQKVALST